jgi:hypothetical protein
MDKNPIQNLLINQILLKGYYISIRNLIIKTAFLLVLLVIASRNVIAIKLY